MSALSIPTNGADDASSALAAAIAILGDTTDRVTLVADGPLHFGSEVTVPWNTHIDLAGQSFTVDGNITAFRVEKGGSVWNGEAKLSGGSYSGIVCVFDPAGVGTQGHQSDLAWLHNMTFRLPANSGTAYLLDASADYIQYLRTGDITIQNGAIGGDLDGSGSYCNGNHFGRHIFYDTAKVFRLNNANGNVFDQTMRERNSYACDIDLTASVGNIFRGIGWDGATQTCDADSHNNSFEADKTTYPNLIDAGRNNRVVYAGGEQVGNAGRSHGWDLRMGQNAAKGRTEFLDYFLGGPGPVWDQSIVSGGSIYTAGAFEGGATPNAYIRRCNLDPAGNGLVSLELGDPDCFTPRQNPVVHLIFNPINSTTGKTRIGLARFTTGVDGVYFETDETTHGDANLRLIVENGSTRTVIDTGSAANSGNKLYFATLEIKATNVRALLGVYNKAASNDDGRIGRGIDCLYNTARSTYLGEWNVTTNIPADKSLQPICMAEDASGSARLQVSHFHVIASMYSANN